MEPPSLPSSLPTPNPNSKTIPAHKSAFLRSQIRLLSSILQPSSTWRSDPTNPSSPSSTNPNRTPTDLPPNTLHTVLAKLNTHLQSHNARAYPPQTQRHIAEQLDALYWADVSRDGLYPVGPDEVVAGTEVDLASREGWASLPGTWGEVFVLARQGQERGDGDGNGNGGSAGQGVEGKRYEALRERLGAAIAEQSRQRQRLEGYRRVAKLVEGVQTVGREGEGVKGDEGAAELGKELERLRGLVGEVVGRVRELRSSSNDQRIGEDGGVVREGKQGRGIRERENDRLRDVMDVL